MRRTIAVLRALVSLILGILGVVFVVGFTDPESRWKGPSLAVMGFSCLFLAFCIRTLIKAFRKEPGE